MQERAVDETTSQGKKTKQKNRTKPKPLNYSTLLCKICMVQAPAEVESCS